MDARLLKKFDPVPALLALTALFLSLYQIQKSGNLNAYYTAAAVSMSQSWHNFFYNSFDPGGFISIDKPPFAFWLQAISVKLLGLHSWTLALPSALAFAGSVALLYLTMRRTFGLAAARLAALLLTLTPIAAAVSRTNNVDSVLVFVLLLAAYALTRAMDSGRLSTLCLAFALVGVGFNTKMLQAYLVLPGFLLFALVSRKHSLRRTIAHLSAAGALLAAVSLSWAVAVDSTPAAERPYVGSSDSNSVLQLALGYNGIGRLTGDLSVNPFSSSDIPDRASSAGLASSLPNPLSARQAQTERGSGVSPPASADGEAFEPAGRTTASTIGEDGPPGWLRLMDVKLAGQISWLLPFALLSAVMLWFRQPERRRELLLWLGWLLPMIAVFSVAGFFHRYYLIMLAPAIAALAGAGLANLLRSPKLPWLLPSAAAVFGTIVYIANDAGFTRIGWSAAAAGGISLALSRIKVRPLPTFALALTLISAVIVPGYWSITPAIYGGSSRQPYASPSLASSGGWSRDGEPLDASLVHYLLSHRDGAKYLVAMPSSNSGADALIIQTRQPVLTWGGFKGEDPAIDAQGLRRMIDRGEVRYFLVGESSRGNREMVRWVEEHGTVVPQSEWRPLAEAGGRETEADKAAQLLGKVTDKLGLRQTYTLYKIEKEAQG
ncbi:glycosyltransferase family 39 protein [Saccharibacillus sp. CPCC 101409]|uniref:glycosyltransferase family 39 protein n=1 Tax=Saccharibacillus sp. CPCC 101409 TaxID=3058041 RepID=UPI002673BF4E|nr:glycosyltransferase family 39 protein [Saccharibacillus sp. CPCC 101409]MDO3412758.1 glycosyltransferase family 39 protein [Saccharibacillus sp. CPCC 101409]